MTENNNDNRNIWTRGIYMILMFFALHLSISIVFIITIIQFIIMLMNEKLNDRLSLFGKDMGQYIQQVINFLTFASEVTPFPFNDWPTRN